MFTMSPKIYYFKISSFGEANKDSFQLINIDYNVPRFRTFNIQVVVCLQVG